MIQCKKHKQYRGYNKPTKTPADCITCWLMYLQACEGLWERKLTISEVQKLIEAVSCSTTMKELIERIDIL